MTARDRTKLCAAGYFIINSSSSLARGVSF